MTLLARAAAVHRRAALRIALFSGLSDPSTCALTAVQTRFLSALDAPREAKVYANFPYVETPPPLLRTPRLWVASWHNARQFLGASHAGTVAHARRHWRALRDSCDELFVITLSCGLEILRHCVEPEDARGLHVLALGPVARARPAVPCTLARGGRDPIARLFFPRVDHLLPNVGHMNYLQSDAVLQLANELLCSNTSRSSAPAFISRTAV